MVDTMIEKLQKYNSLSKEVVEKIKILDEQYCMGLYRSGRIPADYGIKVLESINEYPDVELIEKIDDYFDTTQTSLLKKHFKEAGFDIYKCRRAGRWQVWAFRRGCWRFDGAFATAREARKQYKARKVKGFQTEMKRVVY